MKLIAFMNGAMELLYMNIKHISHYTQASKESYKTFFEHALKDFSEGKIDPTSTDHQLDSAKVLINYVLSNFNTDEFNVAIDTLNDKK